MILNIIILALVTLQRLGELVLAGRNTKRLMARGATEIGADHYPIIVGLHFAWLVGLWLMAWNRPVSWLWLGVYVLLQGLRAWTLMSLGDRWTTRIIVLPDAPLVRRGPYKLIPHPNYVVVVAELAVLPLVFHMPGYALVFSLLNASILWVRIRIEGQALRPKDGDPQML